ncbi:phosphatidylinositol 3,4,5-trisphosphate 5-phosphatase 1 isoform X5 [Triplophysa rosa]|uniref:phosphatidylinositol 3,4,5-trisphosphate 5-phosphatase 1 isoform X5 n=1 Tax=Triplophysa rosa TaxID=992332 RepID=UPI002545E3CA|nr:phosphatidylinositol 3,4,5-trisphosphate 5-phosphatase 1 isoform X5 [Triplophysa rosa]
MFSQQPWYHGNITRSTAEDLLSKAAKDGSFLLRDSESIQGAYALCVLYQNCVYTYRILPNEEKKLSVQASEGVPIRFFSALPDLVEAYHKENMGLVTHLQYAVQKEEEPEEESEPISLPPQLPPRNFTSNEGKDGHGDPCRGMERGAETTQASFSDMYLQRLQQIDLSNLTEDHQKSIQDYFCTSVCLDAEQVQNGNPTLPHFKKLTLSICKNLNSEISRTLPSLEALQKVLDQPLSPGSGRLRNQLSVDANQSVAFRLEQLTKLICSIEDKIKSAVFESVGYDGGHRKSLIPTVTFEVKSESIGISNKMYLKVDVEGGKVYFKKSKDGPEDKYFVHNKILQLVKSQKLQNRLVLVLETEKEKTQRKDFVFDDTKKREGFCQLLQQMKNKHSEKPEPDMITIFVGTWNMGNASPPQNITSWFLSKGQGKTRDDTANQIPHDIYVIGTQEDPLGEKEWVDIVRSALRDINNISFKHIVSQTLWSMRIVVLAKPEHENRISHVFSDSVKTGIANALGNKGAVGVSFMFNRTSFGFVNSHLTSGSEKKLRRNQNYISILRFLNLGDKKQNPFDITHRFPHLFWLGDLNYRVDFQPQDAENIVMKIKQQQYQELLAKDQLSTEMKEGKVFIDYDLSKDALGAIKFMNCVAVLYTKSKTKFFMEYHSSCLEKFVKSAEGENQESAEGSIKVRFGAQVELTPIIADPEYLLDQHILICVKSTDCDESYGVGCVALRSAESSYTEFCIKLTHHGERTGELTGGIQLHTSKGKQTEKLYDFIKVGDDPGASKGKTGDNTKASTAVLTTDISNPNYMGVGFKSNNQAERGSRTAAYSGHSAKDTTLGNLSPKKTGYDNSISSPTGKTAAPVPEDGQPPEMFDNPLYGSMGGSRGNKDQLSPSDAHFAFPKTDLDADRQPPVPVPRIRSFTCSETKQSSTTNAISSSGLQPQNINKKLVVPSRSEGGSAVSDRPPVPMKSRTGQPQEPPLKPRDYRDSSELPSKIRLPARPGQTKDVHHEAPQHPKMGRPLK